MNILILGSGGREHAFAMVASKSPLADEIYVCPGNAGSASLAINVDIAHDDVGALRNFILENKIGLVIIGPEAPLVAGLKDKLDEDDDLQGVRILGPGQSGARLEGSKAFAKEFMQKYDIPTAGYRGFNQSEKQEGINYLEKSNGPYVLKADGLAAGKGVIITADKQNAIAEFTSMLEGKFGKASEKVVVEEFLDGIEFSVFVLTDGSNYVMLPEAKDYKRIGDGDKGPNTGGMGSVSPVRFFYGDFKQKILDEIIEPTIKGLQSEKIPYTGFIFFGLIKVGDQAYVIEYNCRMGDPETQSVFSRIESDLLELIIQASEGNLSGSLTVSSQTAVAVVTASAGYPGKYILGKEVVGLENVGGSIVHHAGTLEKNGKIFTNGGRVLAFTATGNTLEEAMAKSYSDINQICYDGITYRKDIGKDLLP